MFYEKFIYSCFMKAKNETRKTKNDKDKITHGPKKFLTTKQSKKKYKIFPMVEATNQSLHEKPQKFKKPHKLTAPINPDATFLYLGNPEQLYNADTPAFIKKLKTSKVVQIRFIDIDKNFKISKHLKTIAHVLLDNRKKPPKPGHTHPRLLFCHGEANRRIAYTLIDEMSDQLVARECAKQAFKEKLITLLQLRELDKKFFPKIMSAFGLELLRNAALRKKKINLKFFISLDFSKMLLIISESGIRALKGGLLSAEDIKTLTFSQLHTLLSSLGLRALEQRLITTKQAKQLPEKILYLLICPNGLNALQKKLIAFEQVLLFSEQQLQNLIGEDSSEDLRKNTVTRSKKVSLMKAELRKLDLINRTNQFSCLMSSKKGLTEIKEGFFTFEEILSYPVDVIELLTSENGLGLLRKGIITMEKLPSIPIGELRFMVEQCESTIRDEKAPSQAKHASKKGSYSNDDRMLKKSNDSLPKKHLSASTGCNSQSKNLFTPTKEATKANPLIKGARKKQREGKPSMKKSSYSDNQKTFKPSDRIQEKRLSMSAKNDHTKGKANKCRV